MWGRDISQDTYVVSGDELVPGDTLTFTHASSYIIVLDTEPMDGSNGDAEDETQSVANNEEQSESEEGTAVTSADTYETEGNTSETSTDQSETATEASSTVRNYRWIIGIVIAVVVIGVGLGVFFGVKKKNTEEK